MHYRIYKHRPHDDQEPTGQTLDVPECQKQATSGAGGKKPAQFLTFAPSPSLLFAYAHDVLLLKGLNFETPACGETVRSQYVVHTNRIAGLDRTRP